MIYMHRISFQVARDPHSAPQSMHEGTSKQQLHINLCESVSAIKIYSTIAGTRVRLEKALKKRIFSSMKKNPLEHNSRIPIFFSHKTFQNMINFRFRNKKQAEAKRLTIHEYICNADAFFGI